MQRLDAAYKSIHGELRRFFRRQKKVTLAKVRGRKVRGILRLEVKQFDPAHIFDVTDWKRQLTEDADAFLTDIFTEYGTEIATGLGVTFDASSASVVEKILNQANRIADVNDTTYDAIKAAIAAGEEEGLTIGQMGSLISEVFDDAETWRADMIARTESLGAVNGAGDEAARQAADELGGDVTKTWLATGDARTRADHADADGQTVGLDEPFSVGGEDLMYPGDPDGSPDNTINCVLPGTPVQGRVVAALKAWYSGKAIEIRTASGKRLAITPNHPVATEAGFVPARELREGMHLLRYAIERETAPEITAPADVKDRPVMIEEVFEALALRTLPTRHAVDVLDLHGDARAAKGEVEIVRADRPLLARTDQDGKLVLEPADSGEVASHALGTPNLDFQGVAGSPPSVPGRTDLARDRRRVLLEPRPFEGFRLGAAADVDACLSEPAGQNVAADAGFIAEVFEGFPLEIARDEIIEVRDIEWTGHVYDLQTEGGFYFADSILQSNCRCTVEYSTGLVISADEEVA